MSSTAPAVRRVKHGLWLEPPLIAAAIGVAWSLRGASVPTEVVGLRELVQTVVASGHVEAPHRTDIAALITARVVKVAVAEGASVKAGDVLIELDSAELDAAVGQAEVAVLQARNRLRQLHELQAPVAEQALRQARATLDNARAQLARSENLFQQGFIGQAALDDSRRAADLADAQWHTAQTQLATLGAHGSDRALAESALAEAQASARLARARAANARIVAAADGVLISRNVEVGDIVQPGKVLMTLSPAGRTQLVANIDEKNLPLLQLGQHALASADAYPRQRFAAELAYINPGVNAQTGAVEVKLDVPSPPETLRQDMTVSIDIEVARRAQAMLVSADAVHDIDAAAWVWRVSDGRAHKAAVRLGVHSGGRAEVLEGLRSGDVVVAAQLELADGSRVHPASAATR